MVLNLDFLGIFIEENSRNQQFTKEKASDNAACLIVKLLICSNHCFNHIEAYNNNAPNELKNPWPPINCQV